MNAISFFREHLSLFLVLVIFIMIGIVGWKYIAVAVLAVSISVVAMPLYKKLHKKLPAPLSAAVITTAIFLFLAVIFASAIVIFYNNFEFFADMVTSIVNRILAIFGIPPTDNLYDVITGFVSTILATFSTGILDIIANVANIFFGFILLYAVLYLCFIFGDKMVADFRSIIPEKSRASIELMAEKTKGILYSIYVVHVGLALLVFVLSLGYATILGYGHVVFIAMLCGVAALIPMVGAVIVLVFIGLYAISIGDWFGVIITATVGYFLLSFLIDFILRPKLTAKKVQIRPMLTFIGFFGGGATMGIIGFILGPVFVVLGVTGYEVFFKEMREIKKQEDEAALSEGSAEK
ncbi:MAG TPA: AI-2E family transporter [Methanocorpusculum sp.]|nr:AI-2E family transporter [Methanocorpusculum sp.]